MKLLFDENLSFRMYLSAILPKARMHYFHRSHGLRGNASCDALRHKPLERFQAAFPRRSAHRYTQVRRYLSEHMNVLQFKEQVSRKDAKAQRKSLFFAPLRLCAFASLRETSFSSNDSIPRIPRNIPLCQDRCRLLQGDFVSL